MAATTGETILAALAHRGPDDRGVLSWGASGASRSREAAGLEGVEVALLHRRLSILDLSEAGWQPMASPDGRYHLLFNGEIYNFVELQAELAARWPFRSRCDTEVLLAGYAVWGSDVLHRLVGMFAFAVLDTQERTVFLARDPFGIKPLYYGRWQEGLAFASEIEPLLSLPGVGRAVDPQRAYEYLVHNISDYGGETFFQAVRQVPPGHSLELDLERLDHPRLRRYWSFDAPEVGPGSFDEAARDVRALFLDSVRLHMRSDVPVGTALSGGIDSSSIACAIRALYPEAELHAFSYVADDPQLSEERWIDLVAGHVGATVHKVSPEPGDLVRDLDRLIEVQEEPVVSTSMYAQYRVFQKAGAAGMKVMLNGQGADELLGGYKLHVAARLASLVRRGRLLEAARYLRAVGGTAVAGPWTQQAAYALGMLLPERLQGSLMGLTGRSAAPTWLALDWFEARGVDRRPHHWKADTPEVFQELLLRSFTQTSLPMLLRYEDRNSMAHSIESRVPFLTPPLVRYLFSLPESYLIDSTGRTKAVFRQAMRGLVPDAILDRRDKIGFVTPQSDWLVRLRPWVEEALRPEAVRAVPFFDERVLQARWRNVLENGSLLEFRTLWRWINFIRWAEQQEVTFDG